MIYSANYQAVCISLRIYDWLQLVLKLVLKCIESVYCKLFT